MSWTFQNKVENGNAGGSTVSATLSGTNVSAGDVVIVAASSQHGTTAPAISSITESGGGGSADTFTALTTNDATTMKLKVFYTLSATKTGLPTYTANMADATSTHNEIHVWVFTPSAAASLDVEDHTANETGTSINSGTISPSTSDGLVHAVTSAAGGVNWSSLQINSVAADGTQAPNGARMGSWYRAISAGFTGTATGTLSSSTQHLTNIQAFTIAAGGVTPSVNDTVTLTENLTMRMHLQNTAANDTATVTEGVTMHMPIHLRMEKLS